jgi:hypothetical protein
MSGIRRSARFFAAALLASLSAFVSGAEVVAQGQVIALDESQYAAVTDGTESIGPEEMPAYWKLIKFVQDTPFEKLSTRPAAPDRLYALRSEPSRHRGAGSEFTLAVRRVLAYPIPANGADADRLYEVWGWDEQNPGELIVAIVPQLPETFSTGEQVAFRATFRGLFFKLQGYRVAALPSGDRFRTAPLFVGRMIPKLEVVTPMVTPADGWRLGAGGLLVVSLTMACCYSWLRDSRNKKLNYLVPQASPAWDEWLHSPHMAESCDESSNDRQ